MKIRETNIVSTVMSINNNEMQYYIENLQYHPLVEKFIYKPYPMFEETVLKKKLGIDT